MVKAGERQHRQLASRLRREGARLLHAQCWAWGQDIRRSEANLLLLYGLQRLRPPVGTAGCSQYTQTQADGSVVRLWGFGLYAGRETGLYLNRFEFVPRRARLVDAWTPEAFSGGARHIDVPLLVATAHWMSAYEAWVEQCVGRDYRQATLQGWNSLKSGAPDLAVEWMRLAECLDAAAGSGGA